MHQAEPAFVVVVGHLQGNAPASVRLCRVSGTTALRSAASGVGLWVSRVSGVTRAQRDKAQPAKAVVTKTGGMPLPLESAAVLME